MRSRATLGLLTLFLGTRFSVVAASPPTCFVNFSALDHEPTLFFPSGTERVTSLYQNSWTALDIKSVVCDGKEITPEVGSPNGLIDLSAVNARDVEVIYRCPFAFFSSWLDLKKGSDDYGKMKHFVIPKETKVTDVIYTIRYPSGKTSAPLRVVFAASEQAGTMLDMPNHFPEPPLRAVH